VVEVIGMRKISMSMRKVSMKRTGMGVEEEIDVEAEVMAFLFFKVCIVDRFVCRCTQKQMNDLAIQLIKIFSFSFRLSVAHKIEGKCCRTVTKGT